ncbi:hypothetical protein [Flavobacterium sp.]|uniref:hypothetical protein n=1 Tax=Flavobacterium sp. TaxID=239 RepID=UPI0011F4AB6F|nr:hypothetical protein [Flavobacterium sp.]RZJ72881.1 MAG: hypothetical protein EOO49_04405 [Flavobacterium sp.]
MKKILILALAVLALPAFGQKKKEAKPAKKASSNFYGEPYNSRNSGSFDKGTHLISLTYGFPNTLDYENYVFADDNKVGIGPVNLRYEFPVRDEVGVGIALGGATKKWDYAGGYEYRITGISISPLGFYHFNKLIPIKQLDVFAGVGANVNYLMYDYDDNLIDDDNEIELYPTALVGARYYFSDNFSGLLEVGGSSFAIVKIGVSFRL